MNTKGTAVTFLLTFFPLVPCTAEPVQDQDISSTSPWAAHLDFTKLSDPPLEGFLLQIAAFDRVLQLQTVLNEKLAIDWKSVEGVTLFGAGDRSSETAIILRGDIEKIDLTSLPIAKDLPLYHGTKLRQGPDWQESSLTLAKASDKAWIAGTSLQAAKESLDLLAGRKESRSSATLPEEATNALKSAAAMFSIDMKKLNPKLQFEADFTRAIRQAWFLIGSRDDQVEATIIIDSTDAEGLLFLQKHFKLLTALLMSQPETPATWLELAEALEIETHGNWMTLKVAASPEKSAIFLKTLGPLFTKAPDVSKQGN
ncbi:MAG: hypothetical protein ACJAVK_001724 [Akkermansiaceae bacterium]|jgi:hypothetical protein